MATLTDADVLEQLKTLREPELGRNVVSLDMVKNIRICAPIVSCDVELQNPASAHKERIKAEAEKRLQALPGIDQAEVNVTFRVSESPAMSPRSLPNGQSMPAPQKPPGVKNLVAIASGKGGVGKSTVTANLAVALAQAGARVGLCDADVYGPSQATMLGVDVRPEVGEDQRLEPVLAHGVRMMSMGLLTTKETPVIWRGPMATKLIQQFMNGVRWGELDYLLIDLPPGTGDVQLTLTQSVPLTGALVVTTPQDVARNIAEKGLRMFEPVQVPVLGIIENMSYFQCGHCDERTYVFKSGGGKQVSEELGLPLLGEIPLDPDVVAAGDEGVPIVARNPDSDAARVFVELAAALGAAVSRVNYESEDAPRPVEIGEDNAQLKIVWSDKTVSHFPFEFLRNHCPCAVCVDEWTGKRKNLVLLLPSNFRPMNVSPVGNYAIQIAWSDGHNTGIYSYKSLLELDPQRKRG